MAETWKAGPKSRRVTDANGQLVAMVMPAATPEATAARAQLIASAPQLEEQLERRSLLPDVVQALQVEVSMLRAENERLTSERDALLAENKRLKGLEVACLVDALSPDEVLKVRAERDAARAEVERLSGALEALLNDLPCPERELIDAAEAALSEREVAS